MSLVLGCRFVPGAAPRVLAPSSLAPVERLYVTAAELGETLTAAVSPHGISWIVATPR